MFQHQCRLLWHQCIIILSKHLCGRYVFNGRCIQLFGNQCGLLWWGWFNIIVPK